MKVLYVHSFRLERTPDGAIHSRFAYPQRWDRYLRYFDEMKVVCRMRDVDVPSAGMVRTSGPGVSFIGTPDDHGDWLRQLGTATARRAIQLAMNDCDAVILRQSRLGWLAAREAQGRGVPWAVEVVGDEWDGYWNYGTLAGRLYAPVAWCRARRWIGRAPFAIYVTRARLQRRYPCQGLTGIASNVEIEPAPDEVVERRLRQSQRLWDPAGKRIRCGLIGDLASRYKGLEVALRAWRVLKNRGLDVDLHVAGAGACKGWEREAERLRVGARLHLEGSIPSGVSILHWLDQMDFYIQPSLQEGLPRALIEAMSRGLPVLGSSCGGIPELLPPECLHRPGDYRQLADQVRRLVRDAEWRTTLTRKNIEESRQYHMGRIRAQRDAFWANFAAAVRHGQTGGGRQGHDGF